MSEAKSRIEITNDLVSKLISGKLVEICNEEGEPLSPKEGETLRDIVYARVISGRYRKVISIFLEKEAVREGIDFGIYAEVYHEEELYRFPYSKDRKWLMTNLKLAQQQWTPSFMNEINEL